MIDIIIHDIDLKDKSLYLYNYSNNFYLLFKLQKKIYEASKKCHLSLVHGLQKLLLSLNSIKLLANNIVNKTSKQNNNLKISYETSVKIKYLYCKKFNQEITKKILYWLLESEWKPKLESNLFQRQKFLQRIKSLYEIKYKSRLMYLIKQTIVIPKFISKKYLLRKLQSFSWINNQILLLNTEYTINYFYSLNKGIGNYVTNKSILSILIYDILCTGCEWIVIRQCQDYLSNDILYLQITITSTDILYLSHSINILYTINIILKKFLFNLGLYIYFCKPSIFSQKINIGPLSLNYKFCKININLELKPNVQAIQQLTWFIKNILYHKNKFKKIRAKTNLSINKVISKINVYMMKWYKYFCSIVSKKYLLKIMLIIDEVIYRWARKKYKTHKINFILLNKT